MGQRAGDTCGGRRPRRAGVLVAAALVLAGCAGGGDDAEAPAETPSSTTTEGATTLAPGQTGEPPEDDPAITAPTSSLPEGRIEIPLDDELVDLLPRLSVGDRVIGTDDSFDERLCTGEKAPAVPKGQARAVYEVSPTEHVTVAAFRFVDDGGALYLASYVDAVRACAVAVGPVEALPVPNTFGSAFALMTTRGEAYLVTVLHREVLWVMFLEGTDGLTVEQATIDTFVRSVVG